MWICVSNARIESPALFSSLGIFMKNDKVADRRIEFFTRWFWARRRMSAAEAKEAQDVAGKKSVEVDLTRNLRVRVDFLSQLPSIELNFWKRSASACEVCFSPPPHPPPADVIYLVFQFNSFSLVKLNDSFSLFLSLSLSLSPSHTHSKYTHTHYKHTYRHRLSFCLHVGLSFGCALSEVWMTLSPHNV